MEDDVGVTKTRKSQKFAWSAALDQILKEGSKRGRNGSRVAVRKVLNAVPDLTRNEVLNRIRKLKNPTERRKYERAQWTPELDEILRKGYAQGWSGKRAAGNEILKRRPDWPRHVIGRRAVKLGLRQKIGDSHGRTRPSLWSESEDRALLDRAGYDLVDVIGEVLNRSENAVRCKLARLGERSKVSDGYTRRALAGFLHVGFRVVERWIVLGWLKVRDPRISRTSMEDFAKNHAPQLRLAIEVPQNLPPEKGKTRAGYSLAKVAKRFEVDSETVQEWIMRGWLKFCDPHITERSFEEFCKKHGSEINFDLLGRDARVWLIESMGLVKAPNKADGRGELLPVRKQALRVRTCEACHKPFHGNVYFRHIKTCPNLTSSPSPGSDELFDPLPHRVNVEPT